MRTTISKYNILIITPEFPPNNTGGGGIAYLALCKELVKQGNELTILAGDHTNTSLASKPTLDKIEGIKVTRLPLLPNFISILKAKTPPTKKSVGLLKDTFEKNSFDFALIFGSYEFLSIKAAKECKESNLPFFIYSHGYPNLENYNPLIKFLMRIHEIKSLIPMFKNAQKVFSVSPEQMMPIQTTYIPNGIDMEELINIRKPINIRGIHSIPEENTIIFSIGRLNIRKGYQYAIEAVKSIPKVTYIIAGPDDGHLEKLIQISDKTVIFTGTLDSEAKKSYFSQCDIYISPSLEEFFGLTIIEAMAFGKPVISTKVGISQQIMQDGVNGYLVDKQNAEEINNRVLELTSNKQLSLEIGAKARESVKSYTWKSVAEKLITEIRKEI